MWTPWNVFFTSAVVLFTLFVVLITCYLISKKKEKAQQDSSNDNNSESSGEVVNDESVVPTRGLTLDHMSMSRRTLTRLANYSASTRQLFRDHISRRHLLLAKLSRDQKRTLLLARFASFANGASFACHISLLPIQVTSLVDLDGKSFHSYACIYLVCQITRW